MRFASPTPINIAPPEVPAQPLGEVEKAWLVVIEARLTSGNNSTALRQINAWADILPHENLFVTASSLAKHFREMGWINPKD